MYRFPLVCCPGTHPGLMPAKSVYVDMQKDKPPHASASFALKYMCLQNDNEIQQTKEKQHFELWI